MTLEKKQKTKSCVLLTRQNNVRLSREYGFLKKRKKSVSVEVVINVYRTCLHIFCNHDNQRVTG